MDKILVLKREYYYHNFGRFHLPYYHMNNKYFQYNHIVLHKKDMLQQALLHHISDIPTIHLYTFHINIP